MIPFAIPAMSKLAKYAIGGGVLLLLIAGLIWWLNAAEKADDKANQEIGAAAERETAHVGTIEHIKEANDARQDNSARTVDQRVADCLRRSRTPENCQ